MKRSYLYLAAGAFALSACTSESVLEDVTQNQNVIGFENIVDKLARAEDLDASNLKQFYVYGYYTQPLADGSVSTLAFPVFENVEVTKQSNGNWTYTGGDRYWIPGAHYYFYAYSCGNSVKLDSNKGFGNFTMNMAEGQTPDQRVLMINNYLCDNTHQHDLIFASNTGATETDSYAGIVGKENSNADVSLKFKHILSKVQAQFTTSLPEGYSIEINDVRINNIHNVGTYNPNSPNGWQLVQHKAGQLSPVVYLLDTDNNNAATIKTTPGGKPAVTETAYVIPYQYQVPTEENKKDGVDWVYINFDLTVKNNGSIVFEKQMTGHFNPTWLCGYTYTYNIDISGTALNLQIITFVTATGEDWTPSTEPNTITIEK